MEVFHDYFTEKITKIAKDKILFWQKTSEQGFFFFVNDIFRNFKFLN